MYASGLITSDWHELTPIFLRFELSSRLIGIYKVANQTRSVAIGQLPLLVLDDDTAYSLDSLSDNHELSEVL